MKKIAVIIAALTIAGCGSNPLSGGAAGLSAIPGAPGAGSSKSVDAGPLVKQLNESLFDLSRAQQHIFEAFGLKQEAEQAGTVTRSYRKYLEGLQQIESSKAEIVTETPRISQKAKRK